MDTVNQLRSMPVDQQKSILASMSPEQKQRIAEVIGVSNMRAKAQQEVGGVADNPTIRTPGLGQRSEAFDNLSDEEAKAMTKMGVSALVAGMVGGPLGLATEGLMGATALGTIGAGALTGAGSGLAGELVADVATEGLDEGLERFKEDAGLTTLVGGVTGGLAAPLVKGLKTGLASTTLRDSSEALVSETADQATNLAKNSTASSKKILNTIISERDEALKPLLTQRKSLLKKFGSEAVPERELSSLKKVFDIAEAKIGGNFEGLPKIKNLLNKKVVTRGDVATILDNVKDAANSGKASVQNPLKNLNIEGIVKKSLPKGLQENDKALTTAFKKFGDKFDDQTGQLAKLIDKAKTDGIDSVLDDFNKVIQKPRVQSNIGKMVDEGKLSLDDIKSSFFGANVESRATKAALKPTTSSSVAKEALQGGKNIDDTLKQIVNAEKFTTTKPAGFSNTTVQNPDAVSKLATPKAQEALKRLGGKSGANLAKEFETQAANIQNIKALQSNAKTASANVQQLLGAEAGSVAAPSQNFFNPQDAMQILNFTQAVKPTIVPGVNRTKELLGGN